MSIAASSASSDVRVGACWIAARMRLRALRNSGSAAAVSPRAASDAASRRSVMATLRCHDTFVGSRSASRRSISSSSCQSAVARATSPVACSSAREVGHRRGQPIRPIRVLRISRDSASGRPRPRARTGRGRRADRRSDTARTRDLVVGARELRLRVGVGGIAAREILLHDQAHVVVLQRLRPARPSPGGSARRRCVRTRARAGTPRSSDRSTPARRRPACTRACAAALFRCLPGDEELSPR